METIQEAIEVANDEFILSASIFTKDIGQILTFIDVAGLVKVNYETAGVELQAPFCGMKASSSHSREQREAVKEFSIKHTKKGGGVPFKRRNSHKIEGFCLF